MSAEPMDAAARTAAALFPTGAHPPTGPDVIEAYRINGVGGYLTLQQAAEFFAVQRERLQMACAKGRLPARKVETNFGRRPKNPELGRGMWLVHVNDVATYLSGVRRGRPPGGGKQQETEATRRRKARELERGRLAGSAARAARRAVADREQLAADRKELAESGVPYAEGRFKAEIRGLSAHWNETKVRNRTHLMVELERQDEAERGLEAQVAAWEADHGPVEDDADLAPAPAKHSAAPRPPGKPLPPEAEARAAARRRVLES